MAFSELLVAPLLIGFTHSMETDHVLAVGNLLRWNNNWTVEAMRGAAWGLGHTLAVAVATLCINQLKLISVLQGFAFELLVGCMMVVIGLLKLYQLQRKTKGNAENAKAVFFQVGMLHGLAGSGTLAALLAGTVTGLNSQILFIVLFGVGSMIGMAILASLLTRLGMLNQIYLKSVACLVAAASLLYGFKIIYEQTLLNT